MEEAELKKIMLRLRDDFPFYAEKWLKIRTKEGTLIPFELNWMQRKIYEKIQEIKKAKKPVRIIILKYRQGGASTFTEGYLFHETTWNKLVHSLIVTHLEDASANLFSMSKLFYDELPPEAKPMAKSSNARELVFDNPSPDPRIKMKRPGLRSRIRIATANSSGIGRSDTVHHCHMSELAFWPKESAKNTFIAIMQQIPALPNTTCIIESTPNGIGGLFYDLWQQAKRGENDFIPLFFAWFEHPDYQMEVPPGWTATPEELDLQRIYNLTDEQLVWRRWTIANSCGGDEDLFRQEYPSNDVECFLSSGRPVFDPKKVTNRIVDLDKKYAETPPLQGNIECRYDERGDPIRGTEKFVEDKRGYLTIYKPPEPGIPYVIGGDIAEGGIDWSVAQVLDNRTGEQVATWRGHTDTDLYAKQMFSLGHFYNEALLAIEMNFDLHPVKELQRLGYRRQYMRENLDAIDRRIAQKVGFMTTGATRGPIIGDLVTLAREEIHLINDLDTLNEMATFARDEKTGRPEASEGCHDDCVMSLAIAYRARVQQVTHIKQPKKPDYPDTTLQGAVNRHIEKLVKDKKRKKREFL